MRACGYATSAAKLGQGEAEGEEPGGTAEAATFWEDGKYPVGKQFAMGARDLAGGSALAEVGVKVLKVGVKVGQDAFPEDNDTSGCSFERCFACEEAAALVELNQLRLNRAQAEGIKLQADVVRLQKAQQCEAAVAASCTRALEDQVRGLEAHERMLTEKAMRAEVAAEECAKLAESRRVAAVDSRRLAEDLFEAYEASRAEVANLTRQLEETKCLLAKEAISRHSAEEGWAAVEERLTEVLAERAGKLAAAQEDVAGQEDRAAGPPPDQCWTAVGDMSAQFGDGSPQAQTLAFQEWMAAAQEAAMVLARERLEAEEAIKDVASQLQNPNHVSQSLKLRIALVRALGNEMVDFTLNPLGSGLQFAHLRLHLGDQKNATGKHGWRLRTTVRLVSGVARFALGNSGEGSVSWFDVYPFDKGDIPPPPEDFTRTKLGPPGDPSPTTVSDFASKARRLHEAIGSLHGLFWTTTMNRFFEPPRGPQRLPGLCVHFARNPAHLPGSADGHDAQTGSARPELSTTGKRAQHNAHPPKAEGVALNC